MLAESYTRCPWSSSRDPGGGILAHELQIVRRHQNGHPESVDLPEQLQDPPSGPLVQISRGLVREKEERLTRQARCDGDALLLTSGELTYHRPGLWCQAHLPESRCARGRVNLFGEPVTSRAKDTFSRAVRPGRRRKS